MKNKQTNKQSVKDLSAFFQFNDVDLDNYVKAEARYDKNKLQNVSSNKLQSTKNKKKMQTIGTVGGSRQICMCMYVCILYEE